MKRFKLYNSDGNCEWWKKMSESSLYRLFKNSENDFEDYEGDFEAWKFDLMRWDILREEN